MERRTAAVILLGIAFMFIFTAFQTQANIQELVIKSIQAEDPSFKGSGYVSLATTYAGFSVFLWLAPSCLAALGPVKTIFIGGITFVVFVVVFLWPHTWLLYASSVLVGAGGAVIWTAQGNYLTLMSNEKTMARNTGIFWVIYQCSLLFGNIFVCVMFTGKDLIDAHTRLIVFSALTGVTVVGVALVLVLPKPTTGGWDPAPNTPPPDRESTDDTEPLLDGALPSVATTEPTNMEDAPQPSVVGDGDDEEVMRDGVVAGRSGAMQAFLDSCALFKTTDMMLLSVTCFYTGVEVTFFSGVYGYCLSATHTFPDPDRLAALNGVFIGVGEILGGMIFGLLGSQTRKFGRDPVMMLGFITYMVTFFLIFLNLPPSSPLAPTTDPSFFPGGQPSEVVALGCSFLLGFGDACIQTQIFDILGCLYPDNSGPAFALFQFTQCVAATISFLVAAMLSLYWQLLLLVVFCTAGTYTFCLVEWKASRHSARLSQ